MNQIVIRICDYCTTTSLIGISLVGWLKIGIGLIFLAIGIKDSHLITMLFSLAFLWEAVKKHGFHN